MKVHGRITRLLTVCCLLLITYPAFAQRLQLSFSSNRSGRNQVYRMGVDPTGTPQQLTSGGGGSQESRSPDWSRMGMLAYQFGASGVRGIHVMNPDGTGDTRITTSKSDETDASWSPDGRFLAYSALVVSDYDLWVHNFGDGCAFQGGSPVKDYPLLGLKGSQEQRPAWSPAGDQIAFSSNGLSGSTAKIGVIDVTEVKTTVNGVASSCLQAGPIRALTTGTSIDFDPTWSPDGQSIAFSSTRTGGRDIYRMSALNGESDTANFFRLTTNVANDRNPAWSPDGSLIAFVSDRDGNREIYVMSAVAGEPAPGTQGLLVNLTNNSADDDDPTWDPYFFAAPTSLILQFPDVSVFAGVAVLNGPFDVLVRNAAGGAVGGAIVTIVPPVGGGPTLAFSPMSGPTDANGRFSFKMMEPAMRPSVNLQMAIAVSGSVNGAPAFASASANLQVQGSGNPPQPQPGPLMTLPNDKFALGANPFTAGQKAQYASLAVLEARRALNHQMWAYINGLITSVTPLVFPVKLWNDVDTWWDGFGMVTSLEFANRSIHLRMLAQDPPDPAFDTVAIPSIGPILQLTHGKGMSATAIQLANQRVASTATSAATLRALKSSIDRYYTAWNASKPDMAAMQRSAVLGYTQSLALNLRDEATLTDKLRTRLQNDGYPNTANSAANFTALQTYIAANGVPAGLVDRMHRLGFSDADITSARDLFLSAVATDLAPDLFTSLQNEADTARQFAAALSDPDLQIAATVSQAQVKVGDSFTFSILVQNNSPSPASSVVAQSSLPTGASLVSASSTKGSCTAATGLTCSLGAMDSGSSATITLTMTATSPGVATMTATVSGAEPDPNVVNNVSTASATLGANGSALLSVAKSHPGGFTQAQNNRTYTVAVGNAPSAGPTAGMVSVTDTIPAGLSLASMTGNGWTCAANTCTRSDVLSPGSSYAPITVAVNVAANAPAVLVNSVSVSGGGSATATASDSTVVSAGSPSVATVSPAAAQQGLTLPLVAITGQFTTFAQATTTASFGPGITVNSLTVTSPTTASANITITPAAPLGPHTVTLTTGAEVALLTNGFTVAAAPPPSVLSTAPTSGQQGQTLANVIITGQNTHFLQGTTTASFGTGITVNSLTVNSPMSVTVSISISSSATPGSQSVTLTTGAEVASLLNGFIITAPVAGLPNLIWLGGGHSGGVRSVGAGPDGTVWSAGGDNTIKQWNAANMGLLHTSPLAQTSGAAFATNGQQALVIGPNGVQAVSLADGSVSRTFGSGNLGGGAYMPAMSANGQTVAFARSNFGADALVFANGQGPERTFVASAFDSSGYWWGGVFASAVSADGQYVAASLAVDYGVPGMIRLYRVSDGTLIRQLTHNTGSVTALAFSPDGTLLASSSADGKLNVLRLNDLVVVRSVPVFESGTAVSGTALAFSPDGTLIAQGDSYAARIYRLSDGASQGRLPGATASVAYTPDGQWLLVGNNKDVRLWLIATLAPLPTVATHSGSITAVAYSPRGDLVASASTDLTVKLRSAVDGSLIASLTGHTDVVSALAFSPDGDMLATGGSDHTIRIWRTSDFTLLNTLTGHTQAVRALAFSPDGSLLASGSSTPEQVVRLWLVGGAWSNTGTFTGTGGTVTAVQFSPDGQSLASASDGGIIRRWLIATGTLSSTYLAPSQGAMSLAFSPDGQLLTAGWGQSILVFQGAQTAPAVTVPAHSKSGTVVAYSPDGQRVVSGNPDGTVKLWNPAGWTLVTSYNQETNAGGAGVTSVAYAPDGTRFVYGRGDATIGVAKTGSTAVPATVTVSTNPPGLAITVDGTAFAGPHIFSWTPGASHSVSVASPQGSNGTRMVFLGWSDGGAPSHTVTPVESRVYSANFATQYLLTSHVTPIAGGSISASPTSADGYYNSGTVVQLTETPVTGYVFGSWSGDASGTTHAVSVSMNQPRSVTALFSTTAMADIAVAMSSSRSQVNSGKPLAFTATVTNLGPADSGSVTLIANLPGAYSLVSASSSRGSCSGTVQVSCPLGTITAAGNVIATINVTPTATGSFSMTASVDGGTADPNPANNSANVAVTILPAGLPPILWMGGSPISGPYGVADTIRPTLDGVIWATGPQELLQYRASDLRLLKTFAPDFLASGAGSNFAVTPDAKYYAYYSNCKIGVYRADGSSVASFPGGTWFGNCAGPDAISLSDNGQKLTYDFNGGYTIGNTVDSSTLVKGLGLGVPTLSPDGGTLAVASETGIDFYSTVDFSYTRSLTGFSSRPFSVMFSSDGNLLEAANADQIVVWRLADFLVLQSFSIPYEGNYLSSSAISQDGQFIAHGTESNARVWSVADGSLVTTIPTSCRLGVNFTPDSKWLICGGNRLAAFALPEGTPSPYKTGNTGYLRAIAYSPTGNLIAAAGNDSIISVWDSAAGTVLSQVNLSGSPINGLSFSPDGTKLTAGVGNNVSVWNTSGYAVATTLTGHSQPVTAVAFSPDGTLFASASAAPEQTVKLWSTQTWALVRTLIGASGSLVSVQFSPDGAKVVAGGNDGIAREWNLSTGSVVHSYLAPAQGAMRIQYSPNGAKLSAGWNSKVLLFNSGTSTPIQTLNAHTKDGTSVAWSPDGNRLVSANTDGTVDVWDTATWGQLSQYNSETYAQNGGVLTVAYSPDNSQFAYGRADAVLVAVDSGTSPTGTLTTVTTIPAGLNIVVDGATKASPQIFRWTAGTTHTIGVPATQGSSGTRNVFASWSDGGTQSHTVTTPSTSATYTAQFNPQYLLTPSVSPGGSGSVFVTPTSPDGYYDSGTVVQAVATSNLGYIFGTWSGDASGTANPVSVGMGAPRTITANYSGMPTTIVTSNPPGLQMTVDGTQYTAPQSFNWTTGSTHTMAVAATQGARALRYVFSTWGDGGAISHTITAPSVSTTYLANFNTQYPLATISNPAEGGTITANPTSTDGYFRADSVVLLTPQASTGYKFANWTGDLTGTTTAPSITMTGPKSVNANFTAVAATFQISGQITLAGTALPGVSVVLSGSPAASTTTDTSGNYTFSGIAAGGSFTVTPTKANTTFTPPSAALPSIAANQIANFTATAATFQISGQITLAGTALQGVAVALSGSQAASTTTDASGNYSFASLAAGGSFTVTPTKASTAFTPPSAAIANIAANQAANFTAAAATYQISGQITIGGAAIQGVTIALTGSQTASTTTDASGNFVFSGLATGGSFTVTPSRTGTTFTPPSTAVANIAANQTASFTAATATITVSLNRTALNFGAAAQVSPPPPVVTPPQTVLLQVSSSSATWTAVSSQPWLTVSPTSGAGSATLTVSLLKTAIPNIAGPYSGTVSVSVPAAGGAPNTITSSLRVIATSQSKLPFGAFDTPADNATGIAGNVAVTGWALDDVGVNSVTLWRDPVGPEATHSNGYVYVADALFIPGARPDVETSYSGNPLAYRAGWGYLMLTNGLPSLSGPKGNGVFKLHAIATDEEGNQVNLGAKTITVDNLHSAKPFGTLDTPAPGQTISGTFLNWGWAMTPQPGAIAVDGLKIWVGVDGVNFAHPVYGIKRADIAASFPGYANSDTGVGYYLLDTTRFPNGLHNLGWLIYDNLNRGDGIGSRFIQIQNAAAAPGGDPEPAAQDERTFQLRSARLRRPAAPATGYPAFRSGYDLDAALTPIRQAGAGLLEPILLKELDRLEIHLPGGQQWSAALRVGDELRDLPIGSTFDTEGGIFYWQLGPVFQGDYQLEFRAADGSVLPIPVRVGEPAGRAAIQ